MRQIQWRPEWQNFKEMLQSDTVNYIWWDISRNEVKRASRLVFHLSPTLTLSLPFFPHPPTPVPPTALPTTPQDLQGLCQWALYSCIPSQRQEPQGLVQSFPLPVMLLHTNQMRSAEWFRIMELPNWHIMWFCGYYPRAWQLPAW